MSVTNFSLGLKALFKVLWLEFCQLTGFRLTPTPLLLIFEVNDTCNSRCRYCAVWTRPSESETTLSREEAIDLIDQAADLGVFSISFTGGGEPLLRPDLPSLIAHAKNRDLHVALTTNGFLITEKNVHQLLRADVITVSIDSLDDEIYESHRGVPGGLEKAMRGLKTLLAHNSDSYILVQAVLDGKNWRDVKRMNEYFHSLGVDTVFQPVYKQFFEIPMEEWQKHSGPLEFHSSFTRWLFRRFLRRFPEVANGRGAIPCLAGSFAFVVTHRGHMKVCHLNDNFQADLRTTRLQTAWKSLKETRRYVASSERDCICGDTAYIPYAMALRPWK